jgi:hypothetical protein
MSYISLRISSEKVRPVLPWDMVDKSLSHLQTSFRLFFVRGQSGQATSSWSEAPFECFCRHLHPSPRDMTRHPPLACVALKRKLAARGQRAPRMPSIVGWFCRLPWLVSVAGSVAAEDCHLAHEAAQEPLATRHADATSVIVGAPPLQMGEQLWGRLGRRPGATSQGGSSMADGQIDPRNLGGVQATRKASSL